uniref:Sushi domain-containing protein n=1 Tax=Mola mola TaxID=94237 RepID=A0A3Q3WVK6_MOLML
MDLESPSFSVFVLVTCLLVVVRFSKGDISCLCPQIPQVNLTEHPPRKCFQVGERFRYTCKAGYLRKAGTSNLITCKKINNTALWTPLSLRCICKIYSFLCHTDTTHEPVIATTVSELYICMDFEYKNTNKLMINY